MKKFILLFRGGNAPEDKYEEVMKAWGEYIEEMTKRGSYKGGMPLAGGKVVSSDSIEEYASSENDINGYSEIEAESIDQAVQAAKMAPNLKYGGSVEVRVDMEITGM